MPSTALDHPYFYYDRYGRRVEFGPSHLVSYGEDPTLTLALSEVHKANLRLSLALLQGRPLEQLVDCFGDLRQAAWVGMQACRLGWIVESQIPPPRTRTVPSPSPTVRPTIDDLF